MPSAMLSMNSTIPYIAVVSIAAVFTALGFISQLQLIIVAAIFGFLSLIDAIDDLTEAIENTGE